MAKLIVQQSSVWRGPSEILLIWWFGAQVTFPIINVENMCVLLNIFVETVKKNFWTSKKLKKDNLCEIWMFIFWNIIQINIYIYK